MWLKNYLKYHKIKIRLIYWVAIILGMVFLVLPTFVFFYSFDEQKIKNLITTKFNNQNRNIVISGHIRPKFWHGLSMQINDISIQNKTGNNLVHIKSLEYQISWLFLMLGNYYVRRISLDGVNINSKNSLNYGLENLINTHNGYNLALHHLNFINISNINTVNDINSEYHIDNGNVKIMREGSRFIFYIGSKLAFLEEPSYLSITGNTNKIKNNELIFNSFYIRLYNENLQLNLTADAIYNLKQKQFVFNKLLGIISINNYAGTLNIDQVTLSAQNTTAKNGKINLGVHNDLSGQNINLYFNQLTSSDYKEALIDQVNFRYGSNIINHLFVINSDFKNLTINKNATFVSESCTNNLDFKSPNIMAGEIHALLSGSCKYIAKEKLFDFKLKGLLDKTPVDLDLSLINNKTKPHIKANINIESLDLSRFKLRNHQSIPLYFDTSTLPFFWISLITMQGDLKIKHVLLDRINIDNLSTNFEVKKNVLNIKKITSNLYGGILSGSAQIIQANENQYDINIQQIIRNLDIQNMFYDLFDVTAISGKANLTMNVSTNKVVSYNDLHKNITGQVAIDAHHGEFQGIDFSLFIRPQDINLNDKRSTIFERLNAGFNFTDGVSKQSSLTFSSPYVVASGGGLLDFANTKINYNLLMKSPLPQNDQKLSLVIIPVSIKGDLFNPKININNIHLVPSSKENLIIKPKSS